MSILLDDGYAELPEHPHGSYCHLTLKGGALAGASAARPFTRKAADKALAGFIERCDEVRERDEFEFKVGTAWLFGSMLTDAPKVGDVDIALDLADKNPDRPNRSRVWLEKADEAQRQGRHFSSHFERLTYVHQSVYRFLKSRSRILKLHDHSDGVLELCEKQVIYQDPGSDSSRSSSK